MTLDSGVEARARPQGPGSTSRPRWVDSREAGNGQHFQGSRPATSNLTSDEEALVSKSGGALRAERHICPHSTRQREQTPRNTHRPADG